MSYIVIRRFHQLFELYRLSRDNVRVGQHEHEHEYEDPSSAEINQFQIQFQYQYLKPILFCIVGFLILLSIITITIIHFTIKLYRSLTNRNSDTIFQNGRSLSFQLRMFLIEGMTIDKIFKVMTETARKRLYVSIPTTINPFSLLFSNTNEEIWIVGHPALVKEVFGPTSSKHWEKGNQIFARQKYARSNDKSDLNKAMLYTGDDIGWKHARQALTPFFYNNDFVSLDKTIHKVICKHLDHILQNEDGTAELINTTLNITVDLILQVLYGVELPSDQFHTLVQALAEYIQPGSGNSEVYPGGLSAFE